MRPLVHQHTHSCPHLWSQPRLWWAIPCRFWPASWWQRLHSCACFSSLMFCPRSSLMPVTACSALIHEKHRNVGARISPWADSGSRDWRRWLLASPLHRSGGKYWGMFSFLLRTTELVEVNTTVHCSSQLSGPYIDFVSFLILFSLVLHSYFLLSLPK